jgi:phosphate starvation-inducible PhoH-like protein
LQAQVQTLGEVTAEDVDQLLSGIRSQEPYAPAPPLAVHAGRQIRARTPGQAKYVAAIRESHVVFCYGPAGTGKTYLAVAAAVSALKADAMRKIVLIRPAVEAGESLGYPPADGRPPRDDGSRFD